MHTFWGGCLLGGSTRGRFEWMCNHLARFSSGHVAVWMFDRGATIVLLSD